jgi:hypothetical protein
MLRTWALCLGAFGLRTGFQLSPRPFAGGGDLAVLPSDGVLIDGLVLSGTGALDGLVRLASSWPQQDNKEMRHR